MYRYLYVKEFTMNKNQRLIRERVIKSDYRKVYSLEEIWKWIKWSVGRSVRETSLKQLVAKQSNICLNNRNFNLNLHFIGLWCNWQHVCFWYRRV
jgi:hypothetical protein